MSTPLRSLLLGAGEAGDGIGGKFETDFMVSFVVCATKDDADACRALAQTAMQTSGYVYHASPFHLQFEGVMDQFGGLSIGTGRQKEHTELSAVDSNDSSPDQNAAMKEDPSISKSRLFILSCRQSTSESDEDLWFTVWLLRMLTEQVPNTTAGVRDEDGEVLAIECADLLPSWVQPPKSVTAEVKAGSAAASKTPDTEQMIPISKRGALFRVVFCAGTPILLPPAALPLNFESQTAETITYDELLLARTYATRFAAKSTEGIGATAALSGPIDDRLRGFPEDAMLRNQHYHFVLVNAQVAHVLRRAPWLITRAADAYYNRNPLQVVALLKPGTKRFLFNSDDERLVRYRARFTRCSFAQLVLQEPTSFPPASSLYPADPREQAGASVTDTAGTRGESSREDEEGPRASKCAYDLGIKITIGLELLAQGHGKYVDEGPFAGKPVESHAGQFARDWTDYIDALISQSYFSGDTGSDQWYDDVDRAKDAFTKVVMQPSRNSIDSLKGDSLYDLQRAPCFAVRSLSSEICSHLEYADALRVSANGVGDDDDSWMELKEEDLDDAIRERSRDAEMDETHNTATESVRVASPDAHNQQQQQQEEASGDHACALDKDKLTDFVNRMNSFIENSSGLDGVEVHDTDRDEPSWKNRFRVNEFLPDDALELETDTMISALKKALQVNMQECSSDDDDDDFDDDDDDDDDIDGLFENDDMDDDKEITQEVLCELSDYVAKRKEDEAQSKSFVQSCMSACVNNNDDTLLSTIEEIKKSLVLDESSDSDDDSCDGTDAEVGMAMDSMRAELGEHPALQQSFSRKPESMSSHGDGVDELTPLDIDYNMVKSLLDSVVAEEGLPGPASNLMKSLGLDLETGNR